MPNPLYASNAHNKMFELQPSVTNNKIKEVISMKYIILILIVLCLITCGCTSISIQGYSPEDRLNRDPTIIAACQYEYWLNTTHSVQVINYGDITQTNKSDVYWICYYRDNHITSQKIGDFTDTISASNYIWYYYEQGKSYPLIYVK
jgi:hypothetical protein